MGPHLSLHMQTYSAKYHTIEMCNFSCVCVCVCALSHFRSVQLFETLWTVVRQSPLSMGFSRQEYWSGLPCPPPGDLPNPRIKPTSLMSPALAGGFFTPAPPGEGSNQIYLKSKFVDPCISYDSCFIVSAQVEAPSSRAPPSQSDGG